MPVATPRLMVTTSSITSLHSEYVSIQLHVLSLLPPHLPGHLYSPSHSDSQAGPPCSSLLTSCVSVTCSMSQPGHLSLHQIFSWLKAFWWLPVCNPLWVSCTVSPWDLYQPCSFRLENTSHSFLSVPNDILMPCGAQL